MPTTFNASQTEVRQNSILAGLQLQLPLYIRAARQGLAGYEAAGGLYQPIRDVLVGSEDADQISTQIDKDLQTSGMILDEEAGLTGFLLRHIITRKTEKNREKSRKGKIPDVAAIPGL